MNESANFVIPITVTLSIGQPELVQPPQTEFDRVKKQLQSQLSTQLDKILEQKNASSSN